MKKNIPYIIVLLVVCSTFVSAQSLRSRAMGGMNLTIRDSDNSLNLYDFGNNPAWLYNDEAKDWLKIIPGLISSSGDYKRKYDPSEVVSYGITFDGLKTLGDAGTFRGYTSYDIENYNNIYGSLRRFTYDGDAFFLADTSLGSFLYNGPTINFMYSLEVLPDFFAGASISYQIMEGLKDVYSRAQTLIRRISGNIGLAYKPAQNFSFGLSYEPGELQERIESKSEDLLDVELFLFRGETYAIKRRGSSVDYKTKNSSQNISTQFNYLVSDKVEFSGKGTYSFGNTRIIIPSGLIKEFEEGYAFFDGANIQLISIMEPIEHTTLGLFADYFKKSSWSKHSARELLLWEWDVSGITFGSGISYSFVPQNLITGVEYYFQSTSSDSSKYIDNRFSNLKSENHLIKIGAEFIASSLITLRAGFGYGTKEYDLVYGGKDVKYTSINGGLGVYFFKDAVIDILLEYRKQSPQDPAELSKSFFSSFICLKLLTF